MLQYEYKFRWLDEEPPVEKVVYASDLQEAKRIAAEEWPELDPDKAQVERIKGNGEPELPLPGA